MLIGIGENEEKIKNKAKELGIEKDVLFMGFQNNINEFMSAMDIFILSSLYEGLPVVGIEAQASGLPCFMSKDVITKEVQITKCVKFISLNKSAKEWADEILESDLSRKNTYKELKQAGYFIEDVSKELEEFYINKELVCNKKRNKIKIK
jgi:glycosyltransferase involved in cell wall biosynthesis